MLRTLYANGRAVLPSPTVTVGAGVMNGGGATYYFWIKARNRVGYSAPSLPTSIIVGSSSSVTIESTSFTTLPHEDWRSFVVLLGTTNVIADARVIASVKLYTENQSTPVTLSDIVLNNQQILTSTAVVNTVNDLPSYAVPEGYRILVTDLGNVYERKSTLVAANNLTVLEYPTGTTWTLVQSNTLTELNLAASKELFQVTSEELEKVPVFPGNFITVPTLYYIFNDDTADIDAGELDLNIYRSSERIRLTAKVEVLGYLSTTSYSLDTTGIPYIGSTLDYPASTIELPKPLPAGSILVFSVLPVLDAGVELGPGEYISMYPRLNNYKTVTTVQDWAQSVDTLTELIALPLTVLKDGQSIHVKSVSAIYTYNAISALAANGDTILLPSFNPALGRWIANTSPLIDESVTEDKLAPSVLAKLDQAVQIESITINSSTSYSLDFSIIDKDWIVLTTPEDDGDDTVVNITASNITASTVITKVLELRQRTGTVIFDSSILFPGGTPPVLSGNAKTDLLILTISSSGTGTIAKKRGQLTQRNIG